MNRESVTRLRHDRRLLERRGWISSDEREKAISSLPDAAEKATTLGEATDERGGPVEGSDAGEATPAS